MQVKLSEALRLGFIATSLSAFPLAGYGNGHDSDGRPGGPHGVVRVEVTNTAPIPVVVESATTAVPEAVNVNVDGNITSGSYYNLAPIYINDGTSPVLFTSLSVIATSTVACSAEPPMVTASPFVSDSTYSGTPNSAANNAMFSPGRDRISGGCVWIAAFTGNLVVGPGQQLMGYAERQDLATPTVTVRYEASGYRLR